MNILLAKPNDEVCATAIAVANVALLSRIGVYGFGPYRSMQRGPFGLCDVHFYFTPDGKFSRLYDGPAPKAFSNYEASMLAIVVDATFVGCDPGKIVMPQRDFDALSAAIKDREIVR